MRACASSASTRDEATSVEIVCLTTGSSDRGQCLGELLAVHQRPLRPQATHGERGQQRSDDDQQGSDDATKHVRSVGPGCSGARRPVPAARPVAGCSSAPAPCGRRPGGGTARSATPTWIDSARSVPVPIMAGWPDPRARPRRGRRCSTRPAWRSGPPARTRRSRCGCVRASSASWWVRLSWWRPGSPLRRLHRRVGCQLGDPLGSAGHRQDDHRLAGRAGLPVDVSWSSARSPPGSRTCGRRSTPRRMSGVPDRAVHRRGPPIHPHPAGLAAARRGERLGDPGGRDHREPVASRWSSPLLSRSLLLTLSSLTDEQVGELLDRAVRRRAWPRPCGAGGRRLRRPGALLRQGRRPRLTYLEAAAHGPPARRALSAPVEDRRAAGTAELPERHRTAGPR